MPVYDPMKMNELQEKLLEFTKNENRETSRNSNRDEKLLDLNKDMNTIDSKHSISRHSNILIDTDSATQTFYNKESHDKEQIDELPNIVKNNKLELKEVKSEKINNKKNFYNRGQKLISKVGGINEIISKLNKNSNSNQFSVFRE